MADIEALSLLAMEIITYGGCAKSNYIQALKLAKNKEYDAVGSMIKAGDERMALAHEKHFGLIQTEAQTGEPQVSLLIMHAEDQLMSCETIKLVVKELIELYQNKEEKTCMIHGQK